METSIAFTDGAARGNPGPGGWGAVVSIKGYVTERGGREKHTTNNRMELVAAIEAIQSIPEKEKITIVTDSAYVVNGATAWIYGWQKNGWITKTKEPVRNADLWKTLRDLIETRSVEWKRVPGHSGVPGNERANDIAEHFADNTPIDLFVGTREHYGIDLSNISAEKNTQEKKSRSRSQAYSYVSLLDGVVKTHKTWDECKKRVHGTPARFKKALSPEDEKRIIREWTRGT